jgi:two-component system, OmpR family, sensor histidine kinase TctE
LRRYLLVWILGVVALSTVLEAALLYQNALRSIHAAHDRLLRATAQSIGDALHIDGGRIQITVPFALVEAYGMTDASRMVYRVTGAKDELLAGDAVLAKWTQPLTGRSLMSIHDVTVPLAAGPTPMRMAVLRQPLESFEGSGIALIQVAETLDARTDAAGELLFNTLLRQALVLLLIAGVIIWVVNRAVAPLRSVRDELLQRDENSLTPLLARGTREIQPVLDAMNGLLVHLQSARNQQQRFIADAAHQLRTPLTVLKVQLQSARSGDVPAQQVVVDLEKTVDRATNLANQLLSLAKVEQMRQRAMRQPLDLAEAAQEAALELSPLITAKRLNFDFRADACILNADPWLVGELIRNILSNAIRFSPHGASLDMHLDVEPRGACLRVTDQGPGIEDSLLETVFEPFTVASTGSGLGLAIAKETANALGAQISLENRRQGQAIEGLRAEIVFTLGTPVR